METDRHIAHMDLDTFFVSVERLLRSDLNGKPVIVGSLSDRGVVAACSYESRRFGVHSAMPMKMALRLCPDAVVIRGDMDRYSHFSRMVTEIIAEKAPLYEKTSIDEHYLDITGLDRYFGCNKWMHELRQRIIQETGLPISFGLSVNKTVAKIATGEAKPNGEKDVPFPLVKPFLAPLSIARIPGIGDKTFRLLRSMGVVTIDTLSNISPDMMERVLGKSGIVIWRKANGIDNTPVEPYSEAKSISTETTFEQDTTDVAMLRAKLVRMTEKLCYELRRDERLASVVTVKLRYSDFNTYTMQKQISYTSLDHQVRPIVEALFEKLYQRRLLIRLIGVKLSGLIQGTQQLDLFEDTSEMVHLYQSLDYLRHRFSVKAVRLASGITSPPKPLSP
ncbi:MAG TPA: DNA polymerase IV [Williamwhitmania sp.]|nr:DNA polymerase IV [Williamwhitmania sp.]